MEWLKKFLVLILEKFCLNSKKNLLRNICVFENEVLMELPVTLLNKLPAEFESIVSEISRGVSAKLSRIPKLEEFPVELLEEYPVKI